jgi:hypothetical protein
MFLITGNAESGKNKYQLFDTIGCSFKFPVKAGVEKSIVNVLRITDHAGAVCVFTRVARSQSTLQRQL